MLGPKEKEDAVENGLVFRVVNFEGKGREEGGENLGEGDTGRVGHDKSCHSSAGVVNRVNEDVVEEKRVQFLQDLRVVPTVTSDNERFQSAMIFKF